MKTEIFKKVNKCKRLIAILLFGVTLNLSFVSLGSNDVFNNIEVGNHGRETEGVENEADKSGATGRAGSLIDDQELKDLYEEPSIETSEDALIESDAEDTQTVGWFESNLTKLFYYMGKGVENILAALSISLEGLVYGRMVASGIETSKTFRFEMVTGNRPAALGVVLYTLFRRSLWGILFVMALFFIAKYASKNEDGRTLNDMKESLTQVCICIVGLIMFPYLLDIVIFVRDSLVKGIVEEFIGDNAIGSLNMVNIAGKAWNDSPSFANVVMYLGMIALTVAYMVISLIVAWTTGVLFGCAPFVFVFSVFKNKKGLLKGWFLRLVSCIVVVGIDGILIVLPLLAAPASEDARTLTDTALQFCLAVMIIPLRRVITEMLHLPSGGIGGIGGLMAARAVGNAMGKVKDKVMNGVKKGNEFLDAMKESKELNKEAKMEEELAKAEKDGIGQEADEDSMGKGEKIRNGLEEQFDKFDEDKQAEQQQENAGVSKGFNAEDSNSTGINKFANGFNNEDDASDGITSTNEDEGLEGSLAGNAARTSNMSMSTNDKSIDVPIKDVNDASLNVNEGGELNELRRDSLDLDNESKSAKKNDVNGHSVGSANNVSQRRLDNMRNAENSRDKIESYRGDVAAAKTELETLGSEENDLRRNVALTEKAQAQDEKVAEAEERVKAARKELAGMKEGTSGYDQAKKEYDQAVSARDNLVRPYKEKIASFNDKLSENAKKQEKQREVIRNANNGIAEESRKVEQMEQAESYYSSLSGQPAARNSRELEAAQRKNEIISKYANKDNFDSGKYVNALSHEQKAKFLRERASDVRRKAVVNAGASVARAGVGAAAGVSLASSVGVAGAAGAAVGAFVGVDGLVKGSGAAVGAGVGYMATGRGTGALAGASIGGAMSGAVGSVTNKAVEVASIPVSNAVVSAYDNISATKPKIRSGSSSFKRGTGSFKRNSSFKVNEVSNSSTDMAREFRQYENQIEHLRNDIVNDIEEKFAESFKTKNKESEK